MPASVLGNSRSVVADAADAPTHALRPVRLLDINTSQVGLAIFLVSCVYSCGSPPCVYDARDTHNAAFWVGQNLACRRLKWAVRTS